MPPTPRPGQSAPEGASRPSASSARRGAASGSSSTPPSAAPRSRKPTKDETLQVKLSRMYMMLGTMMQPFGRFYPVLAPIGDNLKTFSDDAAQCWVELAEQDKRVREILESMTSASTWGNVVGIHLAIFASAIPGGEMMSGMMQDPRNMPGFEQDPIAAARAAGMPEEAIQEAQRLAAQMMGADQTPTRDQSAGGPGDTVSVPPAPEFTPQEGAVPTAAPPPVQSTTPRSKAAIVTPEQLGVQVPGAQSAFPQSGPPNGTVGQQ